MSPKNKGYQKPKSTNKFILQMQKKAAEKKLHDLKMGYIKEPEIKAFYEEFQTFMNWDHPLDFKIEAAVTTSDERKSWATVRPPENEKEPYVLEVDVTASAVRKNDYKMLMYHEFTHIYDGLTIHDKAKQKGIERTGSWYTEVHATEIELMCACDFDSAASSQKVDIKKAIPYYGTEITIEEFGSRKRSEIESRISQKDIVGAVKHLQYYIGYIRFAKYHCALNEAEWDQIIATEFLKKNFGEAVISIRDLLLKDYFPVIWFNRITNLEYKLLTGLYQQ